MTVAGERELLAAEPTLAVVTETEMTAVVRGMEKGARADPAVSIADITAVVKAITNRAR
jgi:hypothetical protein